MSDDYRGPYTPPSEPPLTFDPRRPVRGRGGPAPVALIVSAVVLVLVLTGAFFIYRGGVRGPNDAPRPVGEPISDVKAAPPPEAQPQDPAAGLSVYKDDGATAASPTFAPPPEQPAPRPAPVAAAPPPVQAAPLRPAQPAPTAVAPTAAAPAKPATTAAATPPPKPTVHAPPIAPLTTAKPSAPPKPATTAIPKPAAGASGVAMVQIGAYSSTAMAEKGWNDAARVAPGSMAGKGKKVEPVTVNGATLYRTSITGFASRGDAQALCERLKAVGKSCFVK